MKIPSFCYQKAFWLLFSILVVTSGSAIAATNAQIQAIDERVRSNEKELANNDVPQLKLLIDKRLDNIDVNFEKINNKLDKIVDYQNNLEKSANKVEADLQLQKKLFCIAYIHLCT